MSLQDQEIRKYNLLEITVTNEPEWYALRELRLEMIKIFLTEEKRQKLIAKKHEKDNTDSDEDD